MDRLVTIAFKRNLDLAERIREHIGGEILIYGDGVFEKAFKDYDAIIAIMAAGIAVRKIAPLLDDKWNDPGVVVVDAGGRFAVPILGGHHGANTLAKKLSEIGMHAVVTTATEVRGKVSVEEVAEIFGAEIETKDSTKSVNLEILNEDVPVLRMDGPKIIIVDEDVSVLSIRTKGFVLGIGCRKGVQKKEIIDAIEEAVTKAGLKLSDITLLASAKLKETEDGLIEAARELSKHIIFVNDNEINSMDAPSDSAASRIGLNGVCEPSALFVSKNRELILPKTVYGRVTVAIAR
jgi:cobalt-precorrin 5A hydrolase